jgi:hypothetical protein
MKTFVSTDQNEAHKYITRDRGFVPGKIKFLFKEIQRQLRLTEPEPFMIEWNGVHFLVPYVIVANAIQREATLGKHSEHYTHGAAFEPTYVSLDQCDALSDASVELMHKTRFFS